MSLETTLTRAEAREMDRRWRAHKLQCPACQRAIRARRYSELCREGKAARENKRLADAELRRNREADKAPIPGQGTLL